MLILSRKTGQRVIVHTPDGPIWLTMQDGCIECDDGSDAGVIYVSVELGAVSFAYGREYVTVIYKPRRKPRHNDAIGIQAPSEWLILREELITEEMQP